jgi:hypothetical protein
MFLAVGFLFLASGWTRLSVRVSQKDFEALRPRVAGPLHGASLPAGTARVSLGCGDVADVWSCLPCFAIQGWDKTYCLRYLPEADFDEIHFFGDKTFVGGNDFEIFTHERTIGHSIADADPMTTLKKLEELFGVPCPVALTPPESH